MEKIVKKLEELKIDKKDYTFYGNNIVKIDYKPYLKLNKKGKLILMTSINPTAAGEGKTTTAIGLADGLNYINKKAILALREPSMGPVFGRKGTATGGGQSEVIPMEEINLHFTGDIHAISTANNLISACIDNEIYWKSELKIDPNKVIWKRCVDLNDRALREIEIKVSRTIKRKESYTITAASNMMTILSLAKSESDLKERLENSLIGYDINGKELFVKDLKIIGSLMTILKNAINPNFVLTKQGTPTLIHCGPFANIATGTNSIISTQLGLRLADYTIVESGFGSDLGFEKYINLVNAQNDLIPDCIVMVVTLRALNLHKDFENNFDHLEKHINHIKIYNLNFVVAINFIEGDSEEQLKLLQDWLTKNNYKWAMNEAFTKGAPGAQELAKLVDKVSHQKFDFKPLIDKNDSIEQKIEKIVKSFYYLDNLEFSEQVKEKLKELNNSKYSSWPICMVKSSNTIDGNDYQQEFYKMAIKDIALNTGAGFILAFTNQVMSMPGLNKNPLSKEIDLVDGKIVGLK